MEIKDCGLIYNQWLDAEAGDHLNNSHQHFIKFSDELFNLVNLSYFFAYQTCICENFDRNVFSFQTEEILGALGS